MVRRRLNINKLQRVQNSLSRDVTGARRYDNITPVLADLHWLKIQDCITLKIALVMFKTVTITEPTYLAHLISFHTPIRTPRSKNGNYLVEVFPGVGLATGTILRAADACSARPHSTPRSTNTFVGALLEGVFCGPDGQ